MEMFNPPHPGEILKETCLEPLGVTVTEAARALGVTREALSRLINGKAGISPVMAIRLSKALNTTPEMWLGLQQQHDLWHARQKADQIQVEVLREGAVAP